MAEIHEAILDYLITQLTARLITAPVAIDEDDTAVPSVIQQGPLQGSPAPDKARISVTVHENDPDRFFDNPATQMSSEWSDEVVILESHEVATWRRRFTVKARCLLVKTKETKSEARAIASKLRSRIEDALLDIDFTGVTADNGEYVSRKIFSNSVKGEMVQAGGPPNSFDYHIKVRFDVLTTTRSFA